MGALRNLLHLTAVMFALMLPLANTPGFSSNLFFGGAVPDTAPIIIIVIMLDVMMSQIWKSDATPERVMQLNFTIKVHCVVALILLVSFVAIIVPGMVP